MKRILLMLVMIAFAYSGVEAQICKTPIKHKTVAVKHKKKPVKTKIVAQATACRQVPFQVCKISDDRRSVSCYKTTDLVNLTPMNSEMTYYGATSQTLPGEPARFNVKTTVITNNSLRSGFCTRDGALGTVCNLHSNGIERDANGLYYYRRTPQVRAYDAGSNVMNSSNANIYGLNGIDVINPSTYGGYMPEGTQIESRFVPCPNSESNPQIVEWPIPCNYSGFVSAIGL